MIDWTKPVRTKVDHIPVTILTTKGRGVRPVIGYLDRQAVSTAPENDVPSTWAPDGMHYLPWMVLENVPPPPPPPIEVKRLLVWRYYPENLSHRVSSVIHSPGMALPKAGWQENRNCFVEIQEVVFKKGQEDASSSK